MVILEGIRRCGKSYTTSFVETNFPFYVVYKDEGINIIKGSPVDIDDYVVGRDLAYAQLISEMPTKAIKRLFFDRQYLSSYVYGQFYRNKYDKSFWVNHIKQVEEIYGKEFISQYLSIVFIELEDTDFEKIANIQRNKDSLETNDIDAYKRQYELYQEALEITTVPTYRMKAFQDVSYLTNYFTNIWRKTHIPVEF